MRKVFSLLAAGFILVGTTVYATCQTKEQVLNNMSHELTECAAYYAIASIALDKAKEFEGAKQYKLMVDIASQRAIEYGVGAGLKTEALTARLNIAAKSLREKISYNVSNIAILNAEYGMLCKEALADPDSRVKYWYLELGKRQ